MIKHNHIHFFFKFTTQLVNANINFISRRVQTLLGIRIKGFSILILSFLL